MDAAESSTLGNAVKVSGRSFTLGLSLRNPLSPVPLQRAIYFLKSNFGFCLNTYFVCLLNIFFWKTRITMMCIHMFINDLIPYCALLAHSSKLLKWLYLD